MVPLETPAAIVALDDDALTADEALLRLNNAHATELSYLNLEEMRALVAGAFVAARMAAADAFIIAFDETADYDSPNFLWFRNRFERFVYIDRICVDPARRGQGIARRLYTHVFERARAAGAGRVVCEINAEPPNPVSDAFHAALGFEEVGSAFLSGRDKRVRYFERRI
ncbi:hypothetical protein C8N35_10489 [Breoghania corrubedonensis]|uniref:N-acetyltransferase domain-containing protein n=2 Tax=Breoghania corrubedonensis TaxID=665038 RepID=A0A2T5V9N1_9HYPH|nr:GNAT family N-acetyltransferase [Breoghania corrubedonensis]PTW60466.1 hypothetical protein C8N35_10489 [Breoghania corrubedonensis]